MKTYDEPFTFQMSDGTAIGHKIGVAYLVNRDKVTTVFQTYRKGVDDITESDLRQNPNVMELEAINKWNGQLPHYMTQGANTPFITVK